MERFGADGAVVFAGVATQDAIALVPRYPAPDERLVADALAYAGGGPAATAAVACARLGVAARFVGAVAEDAVGAAILSGLRAEGVDVSAVQRVAGASSGGSVIVVDRGRSTRAICNRPGPALTLEAGTNAASAVQDASWVHVDQLGWAAVTALLRDCPVRPRLSVDAGNHIAGFRPQGVALYVPTVEQLAASYGAGAVPDLLRAASLEGAGTVVATAGGAGSYGLGPDGRIHHVPAWRAEITSTLGAGDVFHGALMAAVVRGMPLEACLAYANIAAALSCRGLDGRSAIPTHDEVMALVPDLIPKPFEETTR